MKPLNSIRTAPKSLKIGLVLDTSLDPNDGVQQYVVAIGEWLRSQGHDVHYLVGQTEKRQLPNVHSLARNVSVVFNGNRTTIPLPTSRRKLKAFLDSEKFDVLHVQSPHSPFMGQRLLLAAGPRTAVIGTFHILPYGWLARTGSWFLGQWLRPSFKRVDAMLSVSPAAQDFAHRIYKVESYVLPNVVDFARFRTAKQLPLYADMVPTILFLGRLVPRKGCMVLLKAVAELKADTKLRPFQVVICGGGPLESSLKKYASANGLDENVSFAGFVSEEDKPRYYASADISVFPSSGGESFGIVLLEAMASGKAAVLAGDNPGYRSVMSPKPNLLFDAKDPTALAKKLRFLLTNEAERSAMAGWGTAYTAGFDINSVGRDLLAVYTKALRKRQQL